MSEQPHKTFADAFQHMECDPETERGFLRRHGENADAEKATDERRRQEAAQHDFERGKQQSFCLVLFIQ